MSFGHPTRRVSHASIRTTSDTYGHRFEGRDRQTADALDEAARTALAASPADRMRTAGSTNVASLDG
jgi:hypothetical protein